MPVGKGQNSKQSVRTTKSPIVAAIGDFVAFKEKEYARMYII